VSGGRRRRVPLPAWAIVSALGPVAALGADASGIAGFWRTGDGKAVIEILTCSDGAVCGRIASLPPEAPATDVNNPDASRRDRPLCGLVMVYGFSEAGPNEWDGGYVYDPEGGKTYDAQVTLASPDRLDLRGYVGLPVFGRTETWTRAAPGSFTRCR
jgi:uncharacterized protein (DUF2147 family)